MSYSGPGHGAKKAAAMFRRDLVKARAEWIKAGANDEEKQTREKSKFLEYRIDGEDLDFHALRHTFVTALNDLDVDVKTRQELARQSDVRLTLGTYTHGRSSQKAEAIAAIPVPGSRREAVAATGTDGSLVAPLVAPRRGFNREMVDAK
jgi:integrase